MTQLTPKLINIFANINPTGPSGEIYMAPWGTLKQGLTGYSNDPTLLQNTYYENGMSTALLNGAPPPIQEIDGLNYLITWYLYYLQQIGIPETNASIVYDAGSFSTPLYGRELYYYISSNTSFLYSSRSWQSVSNANYQIPDTKNYFNIVNNAEITIYLPTPSASNKGRKIYIIKTSASDTVHVAVTGGSTIDGSATYDITTQYGALTIISNGTNWEIIGSHI